jgi:sodium-dependent dicarboxylate transporter 2/3/5
VPAAGRDDGPADSPAAGEPGARFDRVKQQVGLVAGPVLALLAYLASSDSVAPALPALMALCVTWWLTEALPAAVVALLAACGAVLLGLATPKQAFGAFGSPTLFLFVGSFFIAEAMRIHGLGERLAHALARRARGRLSMLIALSIAAFVMSMFMSNAAGTAILLPLALSAARGVDRRYQAALVLAVAWSASIGGLGTPVGTPPNLIGLAELSKRGVDLDFLEWMAIGVPMGALMVAGMILVLAPMFGVRRGQALPRPETRRVVAWHRGERAVVVAFAVAIIGWLGPSVLRAIAPGTALGGWLETHLTEEVVALLAGCLLFVLPAGTPAAPRPALTWAEGTQIEWGVILLFGGGMMLGDLARTTGLADEWGRALMSATGSSSLWGIVALCTGVSIVLSEATSNTATATLMAPLAGSLAHAAGVPVVPAVMGATLGASFGFMMPISTAPNALAYATGRVRVGEMMRTGIIFDVVGFVLIMAALRVMAPLMGWT